MNWPWGELGLPGPTELSAIRRAYAERLKETRPEERPEDFQRLHSAYQAACRMARRVDGSDADGRKEEDGAEAVRNADGFGGNKNPSGETKRDPEAVQNETATPEAGKEKPEGDAEAGRRVTATPENEEAFREREPNFIPKEWDFERLFAEGAAEERGRRFQKLMELRQKNRFRYAAWNPPPSADPAEAALHWVALSRAMDLLEELTFSGADAALWQFFVKSELFQYVKAYPDFVFSLEDFLRERPELPETGRRILFGAYGLDAPTVRSEYGALYQLLSEGADGPTDGSGFDGGGNPWLKTRGLSSAWNLLAVLLLVLSLSLMNGCVDYLVKEDLRKEQVRVWMEEDFGGGFARVKEWSLGKPFDLLDTETGIRFRARWDGPRDREQEKRGYMTDYAEARLFAELSAFAAQWNWTISQRRGHMETTLKTLTDSAPPENGGIYLFLPLTGAGEGIRALESLSSEVRRKDWYREMPPLSALYLCWGDWSFYEYGPGGDTFDAPSIQWYYEQCLGADLCRIAVEEIGLARSDIGESCVLLPQEGAVTLEGRRFFHVTGTGADSEAALFHYFLSEDGGELFCVPSDGTFSALSDGDFAALTLRDLYRMNEKEYDVKGFPEKLRVFHASAT